MDEYDFMSEVLSEMDRVVRKAVSESVRDAVREEIALLGLSMEADAEHGLPVTPLRTTAPTTRPQESTKKTHLSESNPLVADLQEFRSLITKGNKRLPAYHVFDNRTLNDIVDKMPRDKDELLSVFGIGPEKVKLYGTDILHIVNRHRTSDKKQERVETFSIPDTVPVDDMYVEENGVFSTDGTFLTYEELDVARKEEAVRQEAERFSSLYEYIIAMDPDTRFDAEELREEYALNWERTPWERLMKEGFVERRHHQGQRRGGLYRTSMLRSE